MLLLFTLHLHYLLANLFSFFLSTCLFISRLAITVAENTNQIHNPHSITGEAEYTDGHEESTVDSSMLLSCPSLAHLVFFLLLFSFFLLLTASLNILTINEREEKEEEKKRERSQGAASAFLLRCKCKWLSSFTSHVCVCVLFSLHFVLLCLTSHLIFVFSNTLNESCTQFQFTSLFGTERCMKNKCVCVCVSHAHAMPFASVKEKKRNEKSSEKRTNLVS